MIEPKEQVLHLKHESGETALAKRVNWLLKTPDVRRFKNFHELLDGFHLKFTTTTEVEGRMAVIDGKSVVNFGSANYLGLEQHPKVLEAARRALTDWGNHSGCSRIFSSHSNLVLLEKKLAELVGAEDAMVCATTSATHQGIVPVLFGSSNTVIFLDKYAHTSMHQAALIAVARGAKIVRTDVRFLDQLETLLERHRETTKVLMIDGIYSMQGTTPDIPGLQAICDRQRTILYIDDAHGIAVYGEKGGGVAELFGLKYDNMILVGGLQKGLGAYGGFVAGKRSLISGLRCSSRSYIFSGTMQPQAVEGSLAAIEVCVSEEGRELRDRLKRHSVRVRRELQEMGFRVQDGDSPIVSVLVGPELRTLLSGRKLFDIGYYVNSVLFPATPRNEGLLRISLNAIHTDEEIEGLLAAFGELKDYIQKFKNPLGPNIEYAKEFAARQVVRRVPRVSERVAQWMSRFGIS